MLPLFDEDQAILRSRISAWVGKRLFTQRDSESAVEERALQLARELGAEGFLKYTVPQAFGGVRNVVQARDLCILREELARGDALADTMLAMQALGSRPIAFAGSELQKHNYLPKAATGAAIAAFAAACRSTFMMGASCLADLARVNGKSAEVCDVTQEFCFATDTDARIIVLSSYDERAKGRSMTCGARPGSVGVGPRHRASHLGGLPPDGRAELRHAERGSSPP